MVEGGCQISYKELAAMQIANHF